LYCGLFLTLIPSQETFEETILSMDAIIVGGGSTLNMLGIWKVQGIDTVLRKAYEKRNCFSRRQCRFSLLVYRWLFGQQALGN
jgi:hypothetical protein